MENIGFRLKAVNNLIHRRIDAKFSEQGLSDLMGMQGPMLGYIYEKTKEKAVFQKDIELEFGIRRSTATVMLQNLEQKGYILREAVEHDARLKQILLTKKAIQKHMQIQKLIDAFNEELEQGITEEEKKEFFRVLDKISQNLI